MKIDVKLFPWGVRSVSGTDIPEEILDAYLDSDRCKDALARKIMIGGLTHITRDMPEQYDGKIGQDDVIFMDGNGTHYIEKFWKGKDGYVYCTAEVFDETNFDGGQASQIKRLKGYLKQEIMLGVSVVVDSITDPRTGKSQELLAIVGFDFTFSPAFKDTKIVAIYE